MYLCRKSSNGLLQYGIPFCIQCHGYCTSSHFTYKFSGIFVIVLNLNVDFFFYFHRVIHRCYQLGFKLMTWQRKMGRCREMLSQALHTAALTFIHVYKSVLGCHAPINTKFPVFSLSFSPVLLPFFLCFLSTKNKIFKFVNSLHHPDSHPFLSKWNIKAWIDLLQQPP